MAPEMSPSLSGVAGHGKPGDERWGMFELAAGQVAGLVGPPGSGLTRLGLSMLASHASAGLVAALDVRGWLSPQAVWELGIAPDRLVVVRCDDPVRWGRVAATLIDGVAGLFAEVPRGVKDAQLRTLGALARSRKTPLLLRPVRRDLPGGVTHLRVDASGIMWEGTEDGHGRLTSRRVELVASGKATRGMATRVEWEDDGTNTVHLVSRLAVAPAERAV